MRCPSSPARTVIAAPDAVFLSLREFAHDSHACLGWVAVGSGVGGDVDVVCARDPQVRWRAAADKYASDADLFRKAYVVSVRVSPQPSLDWEFVQPAVANWSKTRKQDRLRWSVETLGVLRAEDGNPQRPGRKEVTDLLVRILRDQGDNLKSLPDEDLRALGRLYRGADERGHVAVCAHIGVEQASLDCQDGDNMARASGRLRHSTAYDCDGPRDPWQASVRRLLPRRFLMGRREFAPLAAGKVRLGQALGA